MTSGERPTDPGPTPPAHPSRRRLLASIGMLASAGVAGCASTELLSGASHPATSPTGPAGHDLGCHALAGKPHQCRHRQPSRHRAGVAGVDRFLVVVGHHRAPSS